MTGFPKWLPSEKRFDRHMTSRDLPRHPKGCCRWCGARVEPPRRSWCSQECVDAYLVRSGQQLGRIIRERDHGVCAVCGVDTETLKRISRRLPCVRLWAVHYDLERYDRTRPRTRMERARDRHQRRNQEIRRELQRRGWDMGRRLWDVDHIIPVVEGGGCCGLENLRTLCQRCHKRETAALAARRAEERRPTKQTELNL